LQKPPLVRESIRVPNKFCKPHERIRAVAALSDFLTEYLAMEFGGLV
jgi:hypothetical protein|tara:strand:+ start:2779 stop:2919 length:141 start_codon:yes stop_codon:yes gene_type:complete